MRVVIVLVSPRSISTALLPDTIEQSFIFRFPSALPESIHWIEALEPSEALKLLSEIFAVRNPERLLSSIPLVP